MKVTIAEKIENVTSGDGRVQPIRELSLNDPNALDLRFKCSAFHDMVSGLDINEEFCSFDIPDALPFQISDRAGAAVLPRRNALTVGTLNADPDHRPVDSL
jgi:hypothetical protein